MPKLKLCVLTAVVVVFTAADATAQSLSTELVGLLTSNPRIKAAEKGAAAAQEGIKKSFGEYLPTLTADGDTGYESIDSPARRRTEGAASGIVRDKATLTLTQRIFDGGKRDGNYEGARVSADIAGLALEGTRQSVLFDAVSAYLDVLRNSQLVNLARNNEATVQRQLNLESERVQRGGGLAVDELLARSRLQLAKERRVAFEGQFNDAVARYTQIFDHRPNPDAMADPLAPVEQIPETVEDAARIALSGNPALQSTARQVDLADTKRDVAFAEYFPKLDLVGKSNIEQDADATRGTRRDFSVLLKATWELFSGFAKRAGVAEASLNFEASKDNLNLGSRRIVEEVRMAWNEMLTTRERVGLLQNAVNIASEVFDARVKLRDAGRESALNVLDAENEVYSARINFVGAAFDARKAVYRTLNAMGRLTPTTLGVTPQTGAIEPPVRPGAVVATTRVAPPAAAAKPEAPVAPVAAVVTPAPASQRAATAPAAIPTASPASRTPAAIPSRPATREDLAGNVEKQSTRFEGQLDRAGSPWNFMGFEPPREQR